ncbi:MAG: C40 family peptidase [Phaeodactylibacter sp.]|nr:C40 family peptidase [Phaeodactylibacter sp.]
MKRIILWHLALLALVACQPKEEPIPPALSGLIEKLRAEYAPDKRVALFQVEAQPEGNEWVLNVETNLPDALQALKDGLEQTGLTVQLQASLLPDTSLQGKTLGVVQLSACNIRSEARHSAELATQAMLGTPLQVYKESEGWYLAQTPDGYLGWLDSGGFTLMDSTEFDKWKRAPKAVYLPDMGFAFSSPSITAPVVSDLLAGNILLWEGDAGNGFGQVRFPDGREAFIPQNDIMAYDAWLASRQPDAAHIIQTAYSFMGRPYLWGGTSGKGVDCSGFTKTAFFLNGLQLPRDASQQVHAGLPVETDTTLTNLQPGDLLFFGRKATADTPQKITHVAIYLGDGKIIHASGAVKVESLRRGDPSFTEYRLQSFVCARRMLGSETKDGVTPLADALPYQ